MGFRLEFQKVERFRSSSSSTSSSSHYLSKCLLRGTVVLQVLYGHIHFPNSNDIVFVKDVVLQPRPLLSTKKLLVSIAAGVKLKDLQDWAGHSRFIRVMPNTSSAVGVAASACIKRASTIKHGGMTCDSGEKTCLLQGPSWLWRSASTLSA